MPHEILGAPAPCQEIYQRIGKIAAEWSWIEKLLAEMVAHFCVAEPGAMYVITNTVSGATMTDWLRTLTKIKVKDALSEKTITDLLAEIDTVRAERNAYVHGLWVAHGEAGFATVQTFNWDRREVVQTALCSTADLDGVIEHIATLQLMLGNLGIKLGFLAVN